MQAVILVGGEGKRLRPLTSTVPKPVVPLVDRPFISFMLEWLHQHGIDDVIMSCGFLATSVRNVLGDGSGLGIRLRFVEEPDPRGLDTQSTCPGLPLRSPASPRPLFRRHPVPLCRTWLRMAKLRFS